MSYRLEYIGPTQTVQGAALHPQDLSMVDINLEHNKQYLVELQQDGPVTIFNGQTIIDPNTTIWVIFHSFNCRIPYSPEAILKQWRLV